MSPLITDKTDCDVVLGDPRRGEVTPLEKVKTSKVAHIDSSPLTPPTHIPGLSGGFIIISECVRATVYVFFCLFVVQLPNSCRCVLESVWFDKLCFYVSAFSVDVQ